MAAGKVVTTLAGKLGKLLPHLGKNLGKKELMKDLVPSSLMSGGINTGWQLLMGESLPMALLYGGADAVASGGAIGLSRGLIGKAGTKREGLANVIGSFASTAPIDVINPRMRQQQMLANPQTVQVDQQNLQRALINQTALAGQYMPGTMMQTVGLPNRSAIAQQMLNDQGPMVNMAAMERDMASIVGL